MIRYATYILTHISLRNWLGLLLVALAILLGDKLWSVFRGRSVSVPLTHKLPYIYTAFILLITLFTREMGAGGEMAWTPLWSWRKVLFHHDLQLLWQILLNILLFIPLGALSALNRTWRAKAVICAGFGLSLCIEVSQLVFRLGLFEWDDILHNGLGCMLGFALVRLVIRAVERIGRIPSQKKKS